MKQSNEKPARDRSPWHDTELTPREQNIVRALLRIVRSGNAEEAQAITRMITKFDRYIARATRRRRLRTLRIEKPKAGKQRP